MGETLCPGRLLDDLPSDNCGTFGMIGAITSEKAISTVWGAGTIAPPASITAACERQHCSSVVSLSSAGAQWSDDVDAIINCIRHSQMVADKSPSETIDAKKMDFCMALCQTLLWLSPFSQTQSYAKDKLKGRGRIGLNYQAVATPPCEGPSRPGGFHPEALTEPCVSLSTHTARAIHGELPLWATTSWFLLLPVGQDDRDTNGLPLSLHGHYPASSLIQGRVLSS